MSRKKKSTSGKILPVPEPVRLATARDGTGLVYGRDESGNVFRLTPEEFSKGNYSPVDQGTAQSIQHEQRQVDAVGGEALALQVARGASARLVDIPLANAVGPEYAKYLERADEKYGLAGDVAEGVGMVAPLLLGGAPGVIGRAGTAAGALEAAGAAAGRGVARVAGEGAMAGAARWGVEGGGWAAAHELSRQTLKGEPRDWDKLWSATGGGILFGGVLGGGIGAAGRFLGARTAAQRAAADLSPRGTAEEALTVAKAKYGPDLAPELESALAARVKPGLAEDLAALGQPGKVNREVLAQARHDPKTADKFLPDVQDEVLAGHVSKTADDMSGLTESQDIGHELFSGTAKKGAWEQWVKNVPPEELKAKYVAKYHEVLADVRTNIAKVEREVLESGGERVTVSGSHLSSKLSEAKKIENHLLQAIDELKGNARLTSPEIAMHGDTLKRYIQSQVRKKGGVVHAWDDMMQTFRAHSDPRQPGRLAHFLEDESVHGAGGVSQKEINAAYHEAMAKQENVAKYFEASNELNPLNPYQFKLRVNHDAVQSLIRNADDPGSYRKILDIKDAVDAQLNFQQMMRKHYDFAEPVAARMAASEQKLLRLKGTLDGAAKDVRLINQIRGMAKGDPHTWARIAGAMLGGLVGGPVGGALGFAAGSRLASALHPYQNIATAAQLRRLINAEDGWKAKLIDRLAGVKWSGKGGGALDAPAVTAAAGAATARKGAGRKWGGAARVLLYDGFREDGDSDAKAYERAVEQFKLAAANPEKVKAGVAAVLGDAAVSHPEAVAYLANKVTMSAAVLDAYLPTASEDSGAMFPGWWRMEPSDEELALFEDIWEGVVAPRAVLARAADYDDINPEVVDVMDMLHPEYMADFRADLQMALAERKSPPGEHRLRTLSILFRMALTPSMEPEYIDLMQDAHEMRKALEAQRAGGAQYRDRRTFKESGVNTGAKTDRLEGGFGDD